MRVWVGGWRRVSVIDEHQSESGSGSIVSDECTATKRAVVCHEVDASARRCACTDPVGCRVIYGSAPLDHDTFGSGVVVAGVLLWDAFDFQEISNIF
jgi:hypothetical protein